MTVGPDYVRPDSQEPENWNTWLQHGLRADHPDPQVLAEWWATLNDPLLTDLIQRAAEGNLDLKKAKSRVRESRARRGISKAGRLPSVSASASMSRRRGSEDTGSDTESDLYDAGFDASWEIDIFGGVRRSVEAAEAELEASQEDVRDVLVSLAAEVALNYVEYRSFQKRLSIAETNLDTQAETYNITWWRFMAGLTTQLDVEQAKYSLEQTRSQIPALRIGHEQAGNRLAVLLGLNPGLLGSELEEFRPVPVPPGEIAVGIPVDVLRNRPDIRREERTLAARTAGIGVATADLYPKFNLSGSLGLQALTFDNLFRYGSRTYGIRPAFSWNLFEGGRIRSNIEVQNALQEQAMMQYEQTILNALEEVENALVTFSENQARMYALKEASEAAQRAVDLAQSQYSSGLVDFQTLLTAQRSMLSLQDQLAGSRAEVTSDLIRLYKSLGGGWKAVVPEEEQQTLSEGEKNENGK
ncbi:MAG: efflux transporter outer membrane subunit [Nitrospiraceae bacterium]|nr:MAG: efflux transporter outer membrane subunit [Nitrospiraceae bacterium]